MKNTFWAILALLIGASSGIGQTEECSADNGEPQNNTRIGAPLLVNDSIWTSQRCYLDVDYYRVELDSKKGSSITLEYSALEGNLKLELLDEAGRIVGNSEGQSVGPGVEKLHLLPSLRAQQWWIRVRLDERAALPTQIYRVTSNLYDGARCFDQQTRLQPPVSDSPGNLCGKGASNWYAIGPVEKGAQIQAELFHDPAEGSIAIEIWEKGESRRLIRRARSVNLEKKAVVAVNYIVSTAGHSEREYFVRAHSVENSEPRAQPYALSVDVVYPETR